MTALAAVVALGLAACVAVVVFNTNVSPVELGAKTQHAHKVHKAMKKGLGLKHSDMSLLQGAMADQTEEKHTACLKECTSKDCKKACGSLAPGAAAKSARKAAAAQKKGLGLKKGDLSLLKDAQNARHAEEVKHCDACVSADCKANCKDTMSAIKKSAAVQKSQKKVNLGLPTSDLKLLQDAQKRQGREETEIKAMHRHDAKFLGKGGQKLASSTDDVNHQVCVVCERATCARSWTIARAQIECGTEADAQIAGRAAARGFSPAAAACFPRFRIPPLRRHFSGVSVICAYAKPRSLPRHPKFLKFHPGNSSPLFAPCS